MPRSPTTTPLRTTTRRSVAGATPGAARHHRTCNVPVFNRVPAELRVCPQCGAMMTPVSHSSCLVLNVIPARVFVEERLDETVACPNDDTIVSAPPPPAIVERGKLGDTLIVEATADKFLEHQPIDGSAPNGAGADVAPQTLGRSEVSAALDLLAPVARLIQEQTREDPVCQHRRHRHPCRSHALPRGSATARCGLGPTRDG